MNPAMVYLSRWARDSDTYRTMASSLRRLLRVLDSDPGTEVESYPWQDLRFERAVGLPARLQEKGLATATINKDLVALRGVLETAWRQGLIPDADYRRIEIKNVRGKALPAGRALSEDDIEELVEVTDGVLSTRDSALLTVLYACGLRKVEAWKSMKAHFLDASHELIALGKGGKERIVPVPPEWRAVLRRHWRSLPDGSPMFPSSRDPSKGLTREGLAHVIKAICKSTGVARFTAHDLRRSFGTHVLARGGDLLALQRLMGHASLDTTRIYDRRGVEAEERAVKKITRPRPRKARKDT